MRSITLDLTKLSWQVQGWRPFTWKCGPGFHADVPAVPAQIPGSVQQALSRADMIPDWRTGVRTRECEWVEHRHWEFFTEITLDVGGGPVCLHADGLDYSGWIVVDNQEVASFKGALIRHQIALAAGLQDGKTHRLGIVFDVPPEEFGQVGFTSRSRFFKPRYNYSWDWCPRFVPIGIWDELRLEVGQAPGKATHVRTTAHDNLRDGTLTVIYEGNAAAHQLHVCLTRNGSVVAEDTCPAYPGKNTFSLEVADVELWWPNGEGSQPLYLLQVETQVEGQRVVLHKATVGFKHIVWLPCEGAPEGALPWICQVNGRPVFLQGFNWVPLSLDYHSVQDGEYAEAITRYRDAGCNVLRVWGGAMLEREVFYRLCDEAGLFVWQEFPLSSSFVDNWPPEHPAAIANLTEIARDYVRRRGHHVSKLLWCGGNELQSDGTVRKTGGGIPADETHPALAAMGAVVAEEDPGVRYLPTSSSGPRFMADEKDYGKGLHHDVHGPWNLSGPMQEWEDYWKGDDSLFRSEVGCPAAAELTFLQKYSGGMELWPPDKDNQFWMHTGSWWLRFDLVSEKFGDLEPEACLERYHQLSANLQAQALSFAAASSRARFPRCGGFIVWMSHDPFPCAISIALVDADGKPRPAFHALASVFRAGATLGRSEDYICQVLSGANETGEAGGLFETVTILRPPEVAVE